MIRTDKFDLELLIQRVIAMLEQPAPTSVVPSVGKAVLRLIINPDFAPRLTHGAHRPKA